MSDIIKGTYPAIVTPMKRDGNPVQHGINYDVLPEFLEFLAKGGVDGFVVCGCTGADALLSHDEQVEFIKKSNEHNKELETSLGKPLLVIAGDGSNYTYETSELAKRVEGEKGVTTHLQISPYKVKPTQTGILRHYEAIADGIEGRIIVYSVNGRTGGPGILPATALELAAHDQFIAIKEATLKRDSVDLEQIITLQSYYRTF